VTPAGRESRERAEHFVDDCLMPFLEALESVKEPSCEEIAALLWGYQSGGLAPVSAFAVAAVLRGRISAIERSEPSILSTTRDSIEALRLVADAMPLVASRFWYQRSA
jgi:hypothetical protein